MGGGGSPSGTPLPPPPPEPATPASSPETRKARRRKEEQARLAFGRQGTIKNTVGALGLGNMAVQANQRSLLGQ